jgi:putative membrane protein
MSSGAEYDRSALNWPGWEMHCGSSSIALPLIMVLTLLALVYVLAWYPLRKVLAHSEWRLAAFIIGLASIASVWATPLAHLDHRSLIAHMVQHLVLMTIAAPLILLGHPAMILRHCLARCFRSGPFGRLERYTPICRFKWPRALPIFCWFAGTGCVILWHIPELFELGMRSEGWHDFEQITFLAAGFLFWLPVMQQLHAFKTSWGATVLYLFLATLPCDALSAFLTFCGRVLYSSYISGSSLDNRALLDQECAGVIMWVWVTFAYLAPAFIITIQGLSAGVRLPARVLQQTDPIEIRGGL